MAKLLTGTRIYGTANVDSVLVVGNVTSNNSTSNTTGSLIVTGGMGITGNVFMSAGNNWQSTTSSQSYRLGWTDNYFMRSAQFGGIDFTGTYLNITSTFYTSSLFYSRGLIANDSGGNNTVLFAGSSPVRLQNTAASTSNTTGALIVGGGVGVSGNLYVGGTNAGVNGVYTDVLRYSANGLPWVMGGGGGGSIAITNDTTNSTTLFPLLSTANSGTLSTANTSNTKLFYVPSTGTLNATIFNSLSDVEYKENIITITNAVDTINQIDGVSFDWKDNGLKSYGVIAQDIEKIMPELVSTAEGTKSVNYSGIIAFLINSVKELDARVKQLENK